MMWRVLFLVAAIISLLPQFVLAQSATPLAPGSTASAATPAAACGATIMTMPAAARPRAGTAASPITVTAEWACLIPSETQRVNCVSHTSCTTPNSYCCAPGGGAPLPSAEPAAVLCNDRREGFSCQETQGWEDARKTAQRCVSRQCRGTSATTLCCANPTGDAPSMAATGASQAGRPGSLGLPSCATTHDPQSAGNCTLDDIKSLAVNFANFLMGLAAAIFLAIFVWAGFRFILFAHDPGVASESRSTLVNAAVGILIVFGAATIVRFVDRSFRGTATEQSVQSDSSRVPLAERCVTEKGPEYACQNVRSWTAATRIARGCGTSERLCPGDENTRCCQRETAPSTETAATPGYVTLLPACTPVRDDFACRDTTGWTDGQKTAGGCVPRQCPHSPEAIMCCNYIPGVTPPGPPTPVTPTP